MKRISQKATSKPATEFPWWPVAGAAAAFVLLWIVYGPALNGPFVFDDRFQPFLRPEISTQPFLGWISVNRPLLMLTFWFNYTAGGTDPFGYHVVNVLLHFGASIAVGLCAAKILLLAGTNRTKSVGLGLFSGALFLLHPLQTESVSYVVSRSETLSVMLFFTAFALFLYRPEGPVRWMRAIVIALIFGAALSTKEHTLTLPLLFVLTDFYFNPRGIRENLRLYSVIAVIGAVGAVGVTAVLKSSNSAGLSLENLSPASYFFTQGRMIWNYVRFFFLPVGQNLDPDISVSQSLMEHGALFGWLALAAAVSVAWVYRKSWPVASYGFLVFLLLLGPTSSLIPILDVFAEHRLYLPFLGLTLVALDVLRRMNVSQATWVSLAILAVCAVLTFQRNQLWGDPILLWSDAVSKSPHKARPNFQLAHAYFEKNQCAKAIPYFEAAGETDKKNARLLVDWAMTYECLGRYEEGLAKLQQASALAPSASTTASMAIFYGALQRWPDVLRVLAEAEKQDPGYAYIYAYRGDYYEVQGDYRAAAAEYQHAIAAAPWMQKAKDGYARVSQLVR
ncbi:MAG: hypothetical protein ABIR70_12270 [Bryobacteraceae bacterium]